ncbi:hypothetical protein C8R43DRAFT_829693, partial [Mycena crocata]
LTDALIKCVTMPGHGSDHVAIHTSFDVAVVHREAPPRRNLRGADWKGWENVLKVHLAASPLPPLPLNSPTEIDAYTDALTHVVVGALDVHVPLSRPSPFTNRWWSRALSELRTTYNRVHR